MRGEQRVNHVGRGMVLCALLALIGCTTTAPTPKTITDLAQISGVWHGWVGCREGCSRLNATLTIQDDGRWNAAVESNPSYQGYLGIVAGELRLRSRGRWYGRAAVVQQPDREWLTIFGEGGVVWGEFDRRR